MNTPRMAHLLPDAGDQQAVQQSADYWYTLRVAADGSLALESAGGPLLQVVGSADDDGLRRAIYLHDLPVWQQHIDNLLANQGSTCELRVQTATGELRWLREYAHPYWDTAAQRVVAIMGLGSDITEARRAEVQQRQSEQVRHHLWEQIGLGMLVFDNDEHLLMSNPAAVALLELPDDALVDATWPTFCQRVAYLPRQIIADTFRKQRPCFCRTQITDSHQQRKVFDITTSLLNDTPHGGQAVVLRISDATDQQQQEIISLQEDLLTMSGRLAGSIAHELNTPLQSIQSCLDLAASANEQRQKIYLGLAAEEIERISLQLRHLLNLRSPTVRTIGVVDLNVLIAQVLVLASSIFLERSIEVEKRLDADLPVLWARPDHLMLLILNGLFQSLTPLGSRGTVHIATALQQQSADAKQQVIVAITSRATHPASLATHQPPPLRFTSHGSAFSPSLPIGQQLAARCGGYVTYQETPYGAIIIISLPVEDEHTSRQRQHHADDSYSAR